LMSIAFFFFLFWNSKRFFFSFYSGAPYWPKFLLMVQPWVFLTPPPPLSAHRTFAFSFVLLFFFHLLNRRPFWAGVRPPKVIYRKKDARYAVSPSFYKTWIIKSFSFLLPLYSFKRNAIPSRSSCTAAQLSVRRAGLQAGSTYPSRPLLPNSALDFPPPSPLDRGETVSFKTDRDPRYTSRVSKVDYSPNS